MRIQIQADIGNGITLPINYNHLLAGVIYRFLAESDPEYASFLHEEGYAAAEKRFKLFTFSQLMAERRRITDEKIHFGSTLTWYGIFPSRAVLIPFRGYTANQRQLIFWTASVTDSRCHRAAYSSLPVRDVFPMSLSNYDVYQTRA